MTSPNRHIDPADEILATAESFGKADPGPFLEAKIMRALEAEMGARPSRSRVWVPVGLRVAAIALLVLLNIFSYLYLRQGDENTSDPETLAQTYWSHEELIIQ